MQILTKWTLACGSIAAAILGCIVTINAADQTLTERGRWPGYRSGSATEVEVSGNYAYVVAGGLHILDISNPAKLKAVSGIITNTDIHHMSRFGNYVVVAVDMGFRVIDVSDPSLPKQVGVSSEYPGVADRRRERSGQSAWGGGMGAGDTNQNRSG